MHTLGVAYRPDNYPDWVPWRTFENRFELIGKKGALKEGAVPSAKPGFVPRTSFGKPPNDCDDLSTNRNLRRGYKFQVRLSGSGHIVIDQMRLHAQRLVERSRAQC
jgi:hypothetical protein